MRQRIIPIVVILLISLLGSPPASEAANITVDESTCTLINAIISANTNSATGGCSAGGNPSDTIILNADVSLTAAYGPSSSIFGNKAGLPDITSNIIIQAGTQETISGNNSNFRILNVVSGSLTLNGVTVTGGAVGTAGGGIYVGGSGTLTLTTATVTGNTVSGTTDGLGGGIANFGTITAISNSTISNNSVQPTIVAGVGKFARGGGIHNEGTITVINNGTEISNNTADGGDSSGDNGGQGLGGGIYSANAINMNSVTFSGNDATGGNSALEGGLASGGGYYGSLAGTTTGLIVTDNTATGGNGTVPTLNAEGGGMWVNTINTWTLSTFSNNIATGGSSSAASGGGLFVDGVISNQIETVTFNNNQVVGGASTFIAGDARGGGMFLDGEGLLRSLTFDGNSATGGTGSSPDTTGGSAYGGGLYSSVEITGSASFENLLIQNNTSTGGPGDDFGGSGVGAGLAISNGPAISITNSTIRLNSASGGAGSSPGQGSAAGISLSAQSEPVEITATTINNNTAVGGNGGGILTTVPTTIINSTISNNSASLGGGVYFFANSNDMSVQFTTILNNSASSGEAIYLFGSLLEVKGSVLASSGVAADCNNAVGGLMPDITNVKRLGDNSCDNVAPKNIEIDIHVSSTLQNNGGDTETHAIIGGEPNNNMINNVVSCGIATDQRGEPRDTVCDAGSYEIPTIPMVIASVECVNPNLEVTITDGDGPFMIDASAGVNVPVTVGTGTHTVMGPEKWDNLSVQETDGDGEAVNFGQFKCLPLEVPNPLTPAHLSRTTNPFPVFSWTAIPGANRYRIFVFDDKVVANRTVDIRENSPTGDPAPTSDTLSVPLPVKRLFWRVRGRVNRIWSLWSIRFTLFIDPPMVAIDAGSGPGLDQATSVPTPLPAVEQPPNSRGEAPVVMPPPPIQPPNSR
ncbi:MAG: hypothetical protein L0154_00170 [Chloroflexi bacterium]|nr:hypothetical protein [Chloroflexota bacterium]